MRLDEFTPLQVPRPNKRNLLCLLILIKHFVLSREILGQMEFLEVHQQFENPYKNVPLLKYSEEEYENTSWFYQQFKVPTFQQQKIVQFSSQSNPNISGDYIYVFRTN